MNDQAPDGFVRGVNLIKKVNALCVARCGLGAPKKSSKR